MVRSKFVCHEVAKRKAWRPSEQHQFVFIAKFNAVTDGSPENDEFFEATPQGTIEIGAIRSDLFEVGKTYYVDFSEAPE